LWRKTVPAVSPQARLIVGRQANGKQDLKLSGQARDAAVRPASFNVKILLRLLLKAVTIYVTAFIFSGRAGMAGAITALKIQKYNQERVNVFLDGEFALAVTALTAATFRQGQYLSDAEIEQLKQEDERDKAYNRAIRFLGFRARSQAEIERYLRDKGYPAGVVAETISRLVNKQYLDDEAFARLWLEDRARFRPRGQAALHYELKQKGISAEIVDTVLAAVDEDELAWTAVEGKLRRWRELDEPELRQKIIGFLSRRGFNYETVHHVISRALDELAKPD